MNTGFQNEFKNKAFGRPYYYFQQNFDKCFVFLHILHAKREFRIWNVALVSLSLLSQENLFYVFLLKSILT